MNYVKTLIVSTVVISDTVGLLDVSDRARGFTWWRSQRDRAIYAESY